MEPLGRQIGEYIGHLTQLFGNKKEMPPTLDQGLREAVSTRFDSLSHRFSSLSGKVDTLKNHTFSWIKETFSEGPAQDLKPISKEDREAFREALIQAQGRARKGVGTQE